MQEITEAKITMKDGSSYITPIENLDNVKRMLAGKYKDIEYIGYEEMMDEEEEGIVSQSWDQTEPKRNKPGRKPKETN